MSTNIFQAIDIITDSKLKGLKFDTTIIANISKIEDIGQGRYRVEYETGNFVVYSEDPNIIYQVGDSVYIKIPEGDYSNKKFIEGKVVNNKEDSVRLDLKNTVIYAEQKFEFTNLEGTNTWALTPDSLNLFNKYLELYKGKMVKVTATFEGEAADQANYGINIYLAGGQSEIIHDTDGTTSAVISPNAVLDVTEMSGDPFRRPTPTPQSIYVSIPDSIILGSEALGDTKIEYVNNNTNNKNPMDIKEISLEFCEIIDFSIMPYYLTIETPQGNFAQNDTITLKGILYHEGKDITDQAITYQWYEEAVNGNDIDAGSGWKKLEGEIKNSLQLKSSGQKQYKLIAFYEEGKTIFQTITINPASGYIKAELDNNNNIQVYYYEGNKNPIQITENIIYYSPLGTTVTEKLTNYEYLIIKVNYNNNIYTTIWKAPVYSTKINFIGDDLYHYNANSDISAEIANIEHTLEPVYMDNKILKSVKWYILGETEPLEIGQYYNPEKSMMKNIWIDNNNVLHYMIKDTYAIQNWNNTFKVIVDYVYEEENNELKNETVSTLKEIFFIKDGQQGTNGTDYCCIVRPVAEDKKTLLSEAEAIITPEANNNTLRLKAFVYYKGKLADANSFQWSVKADCLEIIGNKNEQVCQIQHNENIDKPQYHLITLKVNIDNNIIYYNYPVCYTTGNKESIIELSYPKYVQYTAAGVSPEWLDKEIVCEIIGASSLDIDSNYDKLLTINNKKIKPSATFDFANGIGVIVINKNIYCPVMMYLNTFGNEAINNWDGTSLQLDETKGSILAPQIGAGEKNDDTNLFTGVIMGKDATFEGTKTERDRYSDTGLFGYKQGVNSFGLMSNGNAYFGSNSNNRIWFLGDSATIEGGGGGKSETGMTINLNDSKGEAIKIGNGIFQVDYDGSMVAKKGTIGGWQLNSTKLTSKQAQDKDEEIPNTILSGDTGEITAIKFNIVDVTSDALDTNGTFGTIGYVGGNDGAGSTATLGISSETNSIVLETKNKNIRLSAKDIYLNATGTLHLGEFTLTEILKKITDLENEVKNLKEQINNLKQEEE